MRPCTTIEGGPDKARLLLAIAGIDRDDLMPGLVGRSICACSLPQGQSFECAWIFRVHLSGLRILEFSSSSTQVVGWQEVGSLNLRLLKSEECSAHSENLVRREIEAQRIESMEILVFEDEDVYAECGLIISTDIGELAVLCAVAPGAVSVGADFTTGPLNGQFELSGLSRAPI